MINIIGNNFLMGVVPAEGVSFMDINNQDPLGWSDNKGQVHAALPKGIAKNIYSDVNSSFYKKYDLQWTLSDLLVLNDISQGKYGALPLCINESADINSDNVIDQNDVDLMALALAGDPDAVEYSHQSKVFYTIPNSGDPIEVDKFQPWHIPAFENAPAIKVDIVPLGKTSFLLPTNSEGRNIKQLQLQVVYNTATGYVEYRLPQRWNNMVTMLLSFNTFNTSQFVQICNHGLKCYHNTHNGNYNMIGILNNSDNEETMVCAIPSTIYESLHYASGLLFDGEQYYELLLPKEEQNINVENSELQGTEVRYYDIFGRELHMNTAEDMQHLFSGKQLLFRYEKNKKCVRVEKILTQ
jgi:hypothetical protein